MKFILSILIFLSSTLVHAQWFPRLSIKPGASISGQIKTPPIFGDGGVIYGLAVTVEPTIITFGKQKQFDLNTDISFIQKGGGNYSPIFTSAGTGSERYPVAINYFSFSPTFKWNYFKTLFVKAGPRIDVLSSFNTKDRFASDPRTRKDFNSFTYGLTYGIGICTGKKTTKFIFEFVGQNDFSDSSYNPASGQTFRNFCYLVNFGVTFPLNKE